MANIFKAIGGGNEIGASCYFLYCDGLTFIFDAGIRHQNKRRYPSFSELLKLEDFDNFNDLSSIFLSHAHYDHNGALPLLVSKLVKEKEIICTDYTKDFTEIQLNILKKHTGIESYSIYEDNQVDRALSMLSPYPIETKIDKSNYSFTFYKSGHIPGGVMTLLEVDGKKILYTGDFSDKNYPFVEKYSLPDIENIDLLILNATNVFKNNNNWELTWGKKEEKFRDLVKEIFLHRQLNVDVNQVNNGLELAMFIDDELEATAFKRMNISIYVDEPIGQMLDIIRKHENKEFVNIKTFKPNDSLKENGIYITLKKNKNLRDMKKIHFNYSLHESYEGIKELILKLKPKKTLITHYYDRESNQDILLKELEKKGYQNCEYVKNDIEYEF